jgi:uncharacterized membrane protein YdjX (TVP38/TMEM64 family)
MLVMKGIMKGMTAAFLLARLFRRVTLIRGEEVIEERTKRPRTREEDPLIIEIIS